ncbi:tyrosine-type recombinase/integrase [Bacillus sp. IS1]|uniref:tyrosine-type recombinase/integrase n=1 Tax=Bacillus TaxID=1386 RepID=UPI001CD65467|nr:MULTISPECIES: tyrosine-type recombinase/integrase [Bacillus]MDH3075849.1 tyrosine-type recombinase/integrase [Bacillus velezensis]HBO5952045.1 tyrosine-type recombinase/integrase [Pseudomonas aeruginosa]MDH3104033.1 tyrosine-type recombinase/integrase [Bacillus velezensis]MDH3138980.1 tyrosine-type recombinase/integrase [Bacillus velezensis]MDU0078208.1 tyrosine-type recombinase/integrase [Bacillus sp. IG2]
MNQLQDVQPIRSLEKIEDMKWALKRFCSERDYMYFLIGINCGLRGGDLVQLKQSQCRRKKFPVKEGKTKKKRNINLSAIYDEVAAYIDKYPNEWMFPSQKGGHITRIQAYRILRRAADMAGIEGMGTHTLRKSFGYWHYKQFRDVAKLQSIFNHNNPETTLRYIGITEEEIDQDLENFKL